METQTLPPPPSTLASARTLRARLSREATVTSAARSVVTPVSRPPAGCACDQQSVFNLHLWSPQDTPNMPISP